MTEKLHRHCRECGADEIVEGNYALGDHEPCDCGGTALVMTLRQGAAFEQGRALGMSPSAAWDRALSKGKISMSIPYPPCPRCGSAHDVVECMWLYERLSDLARSVAAAEGSTMEHGVMTLMQTLATILEHESDPVTDDNPY